MDNLPLNLLTFPLWWYTVGWSLVWDWTKKESRFGLHKTGLLIFARHIKEPLYGDYTKTGIALSFFFRIFILSYKLAIFAIRMLIVSLLDFLYLLVLPGVAIMIIFHLLVLKNGL